MQTVTIECRQYDEWEPEIQAKLVDAHRDINVDDGWDESVLEDAKAVGRLLGIEIDEVRYSGFSKQGDGASVVGRYRYAHDAPEAVRAYAPHETTLHAIADEFQALRRRWIYGFTVKVTQSDHRYFHEYTPYFEFECSGGEVAEDYREATIELLQRFMRWIYKRLENEYFDLMEDDSVADALRQNEYELDRMGVIH